MLAGLLDQGSAEDWRAAKEVSDFADGQQDLLLLTSYEGLGSLEVGALQRLARAALELSLREGFDLAPCETLWKRTPGGRPGRRRPALHGPRRRRRASSPAMPRGWPPAWSSWCATPASRPSMGRAGRERVRERFLVTAALERELVALAPLLDSVGAA